MFGLLIAFLVTRLLPASLLAWIQSVTGGVKALSPSPPSLPLPPLFTLPNELLDLIAFFASNDDLPALALVCTRLVAPSREHYTYTCTALTAISNLSRALVASPSLAKSVRHLELFSMHQNEEDTDWTDLLYLLRQCYNLHFLKSDFMPIPWQPRHAYTEAISALDYLMNLQLDSIPSVSCCTLNLLAPAFTHLRKLQLSIHGIDPSWTTCGITDLSPEVQFEELVITIAHPFDALFEQLATKLFSRAKHLSLSISLHGDLLHAHVVASAMEAVIKSRTGAGSLRVILLGPSNPALADAFISSQAGMIQLTNDYAKISNAVPKGFEDTFELSPRDVTLCLALGLPEAADSPNSGLLNIRIRTGRPVKVTDDILPLLNRALGVELTVLDAAEATDGAGEAT